MKYILITLLFITYAISASAHDIRMSKKDKLGYDIPIYTSNLREKGLDVNTIADDDFFPFSSKKQGTVFAKILEDILEKTNIKINLVYDKNYEEASRNFENGRSEDIIASFGVPQKFIKYSKNEYLYPAFFENKIHVVSMKNDGINIKTKEDLKKYKGCFVKKDKLSDFVVNDISNYNISEVENYEDAFESLLTKKVDYIVAGYYPSQIVAYTLGIRDYLTYTKEAIWKNPMFLRFNYNAYRSPHLNKLKTYLKSEEFQIEKEKALEEVLDIYRKNTAGIVPPKYISEQDDEAKQKEDIN